MNDNHSQTSLVYESSIWLRSTLASLNQPTGISTLRSIPAGSNDYSILVKQARPLISATGRELIEGISEE